MNERDHDEDPTTDPSDPEAEQPDPESAPASDPPPGQEPDEGKTHDV